MELTENDDGRILIIAPGTDLTVKLAENPTTGARWSVEQTPDGVTLVSDSYEPSGAVGGAGQRTLVFRGAAAAQGELKLKLARPWETGAAARQFQARLNIR